MLKRCPGCFGKKTVIGMGMMSISCPTCKGLGQVQDEVAMLDEFLKQKKEIKIENIIEEKGEVHEGEKGEEKISDNNSGKKSKKKRK